jgi:S-formylglutathione hydrolase FrmB
MAYSEYHLTQGNCLGKMTSFIAIVPEGKKGPFPVLYLLHGMSDNYTAWTRRTSIERYVQDLPLIVVMPDGDRSFYCDAADRPTWRYETFMTSDLVMFVDDTFRTIPAREGRAIAGLSMGGYGAAMLALKFPDVYCAGISYSGALLAASRVETPEWSPSQEWQTIFGKSPKGGANDVLALAQGIDRAKLPALWIDCGSEDFLIEENRTMHKHLESLDIPHEYVEKPGEHNWAYWDDAIVRTLPWLTKVLKIDQAAA